LDCFSAFDETLYQVHKTAELISWGIGFNLAGLREQVVILVNLLLKAVRAPGIGKRGHRGNAHYRQKPKEKSTRQLREDGLLQRRPEGIRSKVL
jgi:ribosomal protein L35